MNHLILLRHGQSEWNLQNKFTGLMDVELTKKGVQEAVNAGKLIDKLGIRVDEIHSSILKRANNTAEIAIKETSQTHLYQDKLLLMKKNKDLNERDYGNLVGLNKLETAKKYGQKKVKIWRRSYDVCPPGGESLKEVVKRVKNYYDNNIKEQIKLQKNILIVAHGNSLRAMLICLDLYKPSEISNIEIPTGNPLLISYENGHLISQRYLDSNI